MRAAVLVAPGRMEIRDVPVADPSPTEVLLRVAACGLCGTDFHIFSGHGNYHTDATGRIVPLEESPQILGHEFVGVVEEAGKRVGDLHPGDLVVGDVDGVVVVPRARAEEVLAMAEEIDVRELEQAKLIIAEKSLRKGLARYGRI